MQVVVDHSRYSNDEYYHPPKKLGTDLLLISSKVLMAKTYFYNKNPLGSFAGNFDKPITLNIRYGNTILTFFEFVEFNHDSVFEYCWTCYNKGRSYWTWSSSVYLYQTQVCVALCVLFVQW